MNQMQTSLVLSGDGRELVAAVNASETALERINRTTRVTGQVMKSARDSSAVFERAIEAQRTSLLGLSAGTDAASRSAMQFDQHQRELRRGLNLGVIDAREYHAVLGRLTQQHRGAAYAAQLQAQATKRLTTATAGGAGGMQNFSYQLQDIFTQVGMGVPLLVSLGQQAPQIASGFGTMGAMAGVALAAILPLSAAIFGLGYESRSAAEKVKTSADLIEEALSSIGQAQSTLRGNTLTELDQIEAKYGKVTASVLTLMQAQNELAMSDALRTTRSALDSVFSAEGVPDLSDYYADRAEIIKGLEIDLSLAEAGLDTFDARMQIDRFKQDLEDYAAGLDLQLNFGVDEDGFQNLLIYQRAIEQALAAENYSGALTTITQMRSLLQEIPDGPLREMYAGVVAAEDALRQALVVAEDSQEAHEEIEQTLEAISSIDVGAGIRAAAGDALALAGALEQAFSAASSLAATGAGALQDAQINYQFRDDPVGRAGALAGARFDRRTGTGGQALPDGAARALDAERQAYVRTAEAAAQYNKQLADWRRNQTRSGGARGGGGASALARDHERAVQSIERDLARLAPSYARDVEAINRWREESLAALDPARAGYESFAADVETIFDEKLAEAYQRDLERRTDWAAGIERGLISLNEDMLSFADVSEGLVTEWSSGLEDAFVQMVTTGKAEIGDLVDYTLGQFARLAFQKAIQPGLNSLFDSLLGGIFGGIGGGTAVQSHAGSTIGTGGVRRSYGPGAPLRADERLTVTTMGQRVFTPEQISNGATVVDALAQAAAAREASTGVVFAPVITVENRSSVALSSRIEEEPSPGGGKSYRMVVADEVGSALSTKGGGASRVLGRTYGVKRQGVPR